MRGLALTRAATARLAALGAALGAAAAMPLAAQPKSDWEREQEARDWKESAVSLPSYPKAEDLVEFPVSRTLSFRFFIDGKSLSVGADGVVRYTLVARSPHGVDNVSYEGIRCKARVVKVYAFGQGDRGWKQPADADWRPTDTLWTRTLRRDFFCPLELPIQNEREGLEALRAGRHPMLTGSHPGGN